ncbi:MAG: putative deacylase [Gammaproteobacteria bacterium]|jgi:predicted deacylase
MSQSRHRLPTNTSRACLIGIIVALAIVQLSASNTCAEPMPDTRAQDSRFGVPVSPSVAPPTSVDVAAQIQPEVVDANLESGITDTARRMIDSVELVATESDGIADVPATPSSSEIEFIPQAPGDVETVADKALAKIDDAVVQSAPAGGDAIEEHAANSSEQVSTIDGGQENGPTAMSPSWTALEILGEQVEPGTRSELHWSAGQSFAGSPIDTPVVVVRGTRPGPTLCLTAAVHGDELNGVEITRQVISKLVESELAGTVIGVPIVNLLGFSRGSRYLPDRRDLNRYFPGAPSGSSASRIAYVFFENVIRNCDRLVDFHTGSFKRTNLPQLRADLQNVSVREFIGHFGATAVLHKTGGRGTLRRAATDAGIPAVAFELGEPGTLQLDYVEFGVKALDKLIAKLQMLEHLNDDTEPQPIFYRSHWLRAQGGGILSSTLRVGVRVKKGDVLGVVTNPLNNESSEILAQFDGRILGRALNQFVLPGFATFHVGVELDIVDESVIAEADEALDSARDNEKDPQELSRPGDPQSGDVEDDIH